MIKENSNFKESLKGLGVIFLYLIVYSIPFEILSLFGINYNELNITLKSLYLIIYELSLLFIIIYIYRKDFIPNFKEFIKNFKTYIDKYVKYWFLMLFLMITSNIIVTQFTTSEIAANQASILENLKIAPMYTILATILIAPILEELVFRLSIRKIFNKCNILFILFSGLLFGGMHVLGTMTNTLDLLFIIPYSIPGFIFAYLYIKSENICVPISIHFIHNLAMMILQIILIYI